MFYMLRRIQRIESGGERERIKEFYPKTFLVNLQAGHCPLDEVPELVNSALLDLLSSITPEASILSL
jgi:putative NIF3 family GTP cyclohydrolase 1 type 2